MTIATPMMSMAAPLTATIFHSLDENALDAAQANLGRLENKIVAMQALTADEAQFQLAQIARWAATLDSAEITPDVAARGARELHALAFSLSAYIARSSGGAMEPACGEYYFGGRCPS